jgi:hypothetical protein
MIMIVIQTNKKMSKNIHVGIIGTAGRKEDAYKMNKMVFERMIVRVKQAINDIYERESPDLITLVSGGAPWADHVAIRLFLNESILKTKLDLKIYSPCMFDPTKNTFCDNGTFNYINNPGRMLNQLHADFSRKIGSNSLVEISKIYSKIDSSAAHGFHARNSKIAQTSDYLVALSWSESGQPSSGGTLDTWKKWSKIHGDHNSKKIHICLCEKDDQCKNKKRNKESSDDEKDEHEYKKRRRDES